MSKLYNEYALTLDFYDRAPKAVLAAVAVSAVSCGGDHIDQAANRVLAEWWALYTAGIVPQKPPLPHPGPEFCL